LTNTTHASFSLRFSFSFSFSFFPPPPGLSALVATARRAGKGRRLCDELPAPQGLHTQVRSIHTRIPDSKCAECRVSCVADASRWRRPYTAWWYSQGSQAGQCADHGARARQSVRPGTHSRYPGQQHDVRTQWPLHCYWANLSLQGFARASKKASSYMTIAGSVRCLSLARPSSVGHTHTAFVSHA
jgi:hypothetical protein